MSSLAVYTQHKSHQKNFMFCDIFTCNGVKLAHSEPVQLITQVLVQMESQTRTAFWRLIPMRFWHLDSCPTRNTHAHLCLAPVRRLCAHGCSWGVYSLVFVVSKPWWPRRAVIPDLHLHRKEHHPHISLSWAYPNVSPQIIYAYGVTYSLYLWYVTTFRVTFLSVTHHIRTLWEYIPDSEPRANALGNHVLLDWVYIYLPMQLM